VADFSSYSFEHWITSLQWEAKAEYSFGGQFGASVQTMGAVCCPADGVWMIQNQSVWLTTVSLFLHKKSVTPVFYEGKPVA